LFTVYSRIKSKCYRKREREKKREFKRKRGESERKRERERIVIKSNQFLIKLKLYI